MGRKGISLIELMIVICIISILLAIATINFNNWTRRHNIEKECKELYTDLMFVRQQALVTGMNHRARFETANSVVFRRYSSEGDTVGTEVRRRNVNFPITISTPDETEIEFNTRGMLVETESGATEKSICIFTNANPPLDGIYMTQTRVNVGKIVKQADQGGTCAKDNITIK